MHATLKITPESKCFKVSRAFRHAPSGGSQFKMFVYVHLKKACSVAGRRWCKLKSKTFRVGSLRLCSGHVCLVFWLNSHQALFWLSWKSRRSNIFDSYSQYLLKAEPGKLALIPSHLESLITFDIKKINGSMYCPYFSMPKCKGGILSPFLLARFIQLHVSSSVNLQRSQALSGVKPFSMWVTVWPQCPGSTRESRSHCKGDSLPSRGMQVRWWLALWSLVSSFSGRQRKRVGLQALLLIQPRDHQHWDPSFLNSFHSRWLS